MIVDWLLRPLTSGVLLVGTLLLALAPITPAAELFQITWPTHHASPPADLGPQANNILPAFRIAIASLPEAAITTLALSQAALLGGTKDDANTLLPLVTERYRLMAASPIYSHAPSALPYCYLAERPDHGSASLYVPDGATASTPVILFLHGFGGSFLWYQHWLSEAFSDHIIICPAYGIATASIPPDYVSEAVAACAKKLLFPIGRYCLIGLSNGGYGSCRLFVSAPQKCTQLICLAAYPTDDTLARFPPNVPARFMSGATEPFASSGNLLQRVQIIRRRAPSTELQLVKGADHFFILTHPQETLSVLRKWVND